MSTTPFPHPSGHTAADAAALELAGVDPHTRQPRENVVACSTCFAPTWHLAAFCDRHYMTPHVIPAHRWAS